MVIRVRGMEASQWALPMEEGTRVLLGRAPSAKSGETACIAIPKDVPEADTVSRDHARILWCGDSWWVEQLRKTVNQTCIQGEVVVGFRQINTLPCKLQLGEVYLDLDICELTPSESAEMQPTETFQPRSQLNFETRRSSWPDTYEELRWGACMEHVLTIAKLSSKPESAQQQIATELAIYMHAQRVVVRSAIDIDHLPRELEAVGLSAAGEVADSLVKKLKRLKLPAEVAVETVEAEACIVYVRPDSWAANDNVGFCIAWFPADISQTALQPRTGQLVCIALELIESFRRAVVQIHTTRKSAAKSSGIELHSEMARICEREGFYGVSPEYKKCMEEVWRLGKRYLQADSRTGKLRCILLEGETGTGKSALARIIQQLTAHRDGPFIECNIGALAEGMVQAELFGTERAQDMPRHPGRFKLADKGLLFMDEVSAASKKVQQTLLSVLDTGKFQPVGGPDRELTTNCFVICGSNEVRKAIDEDRFREDLFYRLQPSVTIPPLRERREDIEHVARNFVVQMNQELAAENAKILDSALLDVFQVYDWPGNVRELTNALEIGWKCCKEGGAISFENLTEEIRQRLARRTIVESGGFGIDIGAPLEQNRQLLELEYFAALFRACNGVIESVAKRSGVSAETLRTRRNNEFPALVARLSADDVARLKALAGPYWEKLVLTGA